jgi:hypothetical protein
MKSGGLPPPHFLLQTGVAQLVEDGFPADFRGVLTGDVEDTTRDIRQINISSVFVD